MKNQAKPKQPRSIWLNTYFLFGLIMAVIGIIGLFKGANYIADPGQPKTPILPWLYLGAAILFIVNGMMSHRTYIKDFEYHQKERKDA